MYTKFISSKSEDGVALILVLAFILLLSGVVITFFSRSLTDRQVSDSSLAAIKTDSLAKGAADLVIGDLQAEIVNNSTDASLDPTKYHYYVPKINPSTNQPLSITPSRVDKNTTDTNNKEYANLLKRSAFNQPIYTGSTISRASKVSTLTPSADGRFISPERWNRPLLLEKIVTNSVTDDRNIAPRDFVPGSYTLGASVATGTTAAPDWVLLTENGSNGVSAAAVDAQNTVNDSEPVVGRYAYQVYDEGGLLDMNVAGYPKDFNTKMPPSPLGTTLGQSVYKDNATFADLQQLPGLDASNTAGANLIDTLVAYRNYATLGQTGGFSQTPGAPTFSAPGLLNFKRMNVLGLNTFLTSNFQTLDPESGLTIKTPDQSDHPFATRQELIRFMTYALVYAPASPNAARAKLQNALQYMGTFSRALRQPSFAPATTRPKLLSPALGGNDNYQAGSAPDDKINPAFLKIRVLQPFVRADGSMAVIGEPLVKHSFSLNRLSWLSYEGPVGDPGVSTATKNAYYDQGVSRPMIAQGTAGAIKQYFGLQWDVSLKRWNYVHGISGTSGRIMTLAEVAALGGGDAREPDFFELLKAAISVGALGKSFLYYAPSPSLDATVPTVYQFQKDSSVDAQIMQIGANLVDQFDFDGYPTRIVFSDNRLFGGIPQEYRGIENLPYLYRVREGKITVRDSNPTQSSLPRAGATLSDPGLCAILQEPEIWNPHAWNSAQVDNMPRPTSMRLVAISADPNSGSGSAAPVSVGQFSLAWSAGTYGGNIPSTQTPTNPPVWNESTTEINFGVPTNKTYLYREPTLLCKPGVPDASVQIGSNNVIKSVFGTDHITSLWSATQVRVNGIADNKNYIGVLAGSGPLAWNALIPIQGINQSSPAAPTNGVVEATSAYTPTLIKGITYRLEFKDGQGTWRTYDEKFCPYLKAGSYNNGTFWTDHNKTFNTYDGGQTQNNIIGTEVGAVCFDPRTSRFGMNATGSGGYQLESNGEYMFPIRQNVPQLGWASPSPNGATLFGAIRLMALATHRPDENVGWFVGRPGLPSPGWYPVNTSSVMPGMFSQNNPDESANPSNRVQVNGDGQTFPAGLGTLNQYYADADGVVRRAMAGYVPTSSTTSAVINAAGPSGLPMKTVMNYSNVTPIANAPVASIENANRPIVLNRPFRSPAEIGVVFSGTPWKNLDVSTPESGFSSLLDVFSISNSTDDNPLVAGRINVNTKQAPVLNAILSNAYKDDFNPTGSTSVPNISAGDAAALSSALIARTASTLSNQGPLASVPELVGKWISPVAISGSVNGSKSYSGFSDVDVSAVMNSKPYENRIPRFREASIRALSNSGQSRVWNVMIDVITQTGRFPANAVTSTDPLSRFVVDGEQRYWVHVAIDRLSGTILDKQVEVVKE